MKIDAHNHIGKKKGVSVSVDDFIKSMDELIKPSYFPFPNR